MVLSTARQVPREANVWKLVARELVCAHFEGVEVGDNVVESEGPDHGASKELPRCPALANVSYNMT